MTRHTEDDTMTHEQAQHAAANDRELTRHEANRLARRRHRESEIETLDRTNPGQNDALADAIAWAARSRASRPRKRTKIDFSPFDFTGGGVWRG